MSFRRTVTLLLALAFAAGNAVACAGWAATPEARMSCCIDGAGCAMHDHAGDRPSGQQAVSQSQADTCCAASERDGVPADTGPVVPAAPAHVAAPLPPAADAYTPPGGFRTRLPDPGGTVPKHLLLSVFLV